MRLFETLILITLLLSLLSFFVPRGKRSRWMAFLPGLALLLVLAHLVVEGYRWQMIPAYALTVLTCLATARATIQGADPQAKPSSRGRRALTIIGTVLGLLVLIIAAALPALFPVYRPQEPTEARAGETRIRPADGMVMVYVPTGEFEMGTGGLGWIRQPLSPRDRERGDSPYENPLGPDSGTVRAMRGGAWYDTDVWATCSVRHQNPLSDLYDDLGFSCAVPDQ